MPQRVRRLKTSPKPRYITTCLTNAYILELVAWYSWKLAVCCLVSLAKRGSWGVLTTCLEIRSGKSREQGDARLLSHVSPLHTCIWPWPIMDYFIRVMGQSRICPKVMQIVYRWIYGFRIQESSICGYVYCHLECRIASTHAAQRHITFQYHPKFNYQVYIRYLCWFDVSPQSPPPSLFPLSPPRQTTPRLLVSLPVGQCQATTSTADLNRDISWRQCLA